MRLLKAGGDLTVDQQRLARALDLAEESIVTMPFLEPAVLAALYRRAALVLLPSESEGFGLPLIEAMACATPAIASDTHACQARQARTPTYADPATVAATVLAIKCSGSQPVQNIPARNAARRPAATWNTTRRPGGTP